MLNKLIYSKYVQTYKLYDAVKETYSINKSDSLI